MALARWILVSGSAMRAVLAPDDADDLGEEALGEGAPRFRRRGSPLTSGWLPRSLVLALDEEPAPGPALAAPLHLRLALCAAEGAPGPGLFHAGATDDERLLGLDELLGCYGELASEVGLAPLALGLSGGEPWARLSPEGAPADRVADRLLLLRSAFISAADGRGLALRSVALAGAGSTSLEIGAGLHRSLPGAVGVAGS